MKAASRGRRMIGEGPGDAATVIGRKLWKRVEDVKLARGWRVALHVLSVPEVKEYRTLRNRGGLRI
eukprot:9458703-Pyramimonas_sp.AAC.1